MQATGMIQAGLEQTESEDISIYTSLGLYLPLLLRRSWSNISTNPFFLSQKEPFFQLTIYPHHHDGGENPHQQWLNLRGRNRLLPCRRDRIMDLRFRYDRVSLPLPRLSLLHITLPYLISYLILLCSLHDLKSESNVHRYDHTSSPASLSPHIITQLTQCLLNIDTALKSAGSSIQDVIRVRYILPDARMFPECWPLLKEWFGDVRPAATMIQAGLMKEEMLIEVEATARKGSGKDGAKVEQEEEGGPM